MPKVVGRLAGCLTVELSGSDAFDENGNELIDFVQNRAASLQSDQCLSIDNLQADIGLPKFLERNFHFVNEIVHGFRRLRFGVIQRRCGSASNQLTSQVIACPSWWQRFDDVNDCDGKFDKSIFQVKALLIHLIRISTFLVPCSTFGFLIFLHRLSFPLASPFMTVSISAMLTKLKSPSMECFSAEAATAKSSACWSSP